VLACVTLGLLSGRESARTMSPRTRIQAQAVWEVVIFLLNGLVFILIGLQLPAVLEGLGKYSVLELAGLGLGLGLVVVLLRFIWVFPATYLPRMLSRSIRERDPIPSWKVPVLVGWAGMRGIVSLAAALSLPENFPERDLVLFLTFCVILVTLVGQGLSLPWLVGRLKLEPDETLEREEAWARFSAAQAALERLDQLSSEGWVRPEQLERLRGMYTARRQRYSARYWGKRELVLEQGSEAFERLRRELMRSEQLTLTALRDGGTIGDHAMRQVQRELDLEDLRLGEAEVG
jgi:monovalent cation/hydrogen antiporter